MIGVLFMSGMVEGLRQVKKVVPLPYIIKREDCIVFWAICVLQNWRVEKYCSDVGG
jgi:hypothetical protein